MAIKVGINGYGRIGRNVLRALYEGKRTGQLQIVALNDLCDSEDQCAPDPLRHRARQVPRRGRGRRRLHGRQRRSHPRVRRARSGEAAVGRAGRRVRARVHRPVHQQGQGGAHLKGGAKKVVISAPGGEDVDATIVYGVNHQVLKQHLHRDLQRLLHHQLPRAGRQGAARQDRHRRRPHDHDPLLHQRSGADRRLPLRPAPRPFGHHVADPDQDRRRGRGGPGAAGAQGQARRFRDARADHQRLAGRSDLHREARDHGGGGQPDAAAGGRGRARRASSPTTTRRWSRSTSITTRIPRCSMRRSPR